MPNFRWDFASSWRRFVATVAAVFAVFAVASSGAELAAVADEPDVTVSGAVEVAASGAEISPPAIAGFDRFARAGELDASVAGRLLVTELSCTACHTTQDQELTPRSGPNLQGLGNRVADDWARRFLLDPASVHPGTTMPDMVGRLEPAERLEVAETLAAYLGSFRQPLADIQGSGARPVPHRFWELGDVDRGRTLFHRVGCVACHAVDPDEPEAVAGSMGLDPQLALLDPEELEELGLGGITRPGPVQPMGRPAEKHSLRSLALFLLNPEATRPGLRMPNLKLSVVEAADLAMYLMRRDDASSIPVSDFSDFDVTGVEAARHDEQIAAGKRHFTRLGCVSCHATPEGAAVRGNATPLDQLDPNSVSACWRSATEGEASGGPHRPWYRLDDAQVASLVEYLEGSGQAAADEANAGELRAADGQFGEAAGKLAERMLRANCYACHSRDGLGGVAPDRSGHFATVGSEDLGDEGRLPPPLAGVEGKLKAAWFGRVLSGNGDIRPYLLARMPKYNAAEVKRWVELFEQVQRERETSFAGGDDTPGLANAAAGWPGRNDLKDFDAGRQMIDAGCVQCHRFRGESLAGVTGIDLAGITDRVRPEWFHDFVLHPAGLKPRTRMPTFFPDGISQNRELLGGDAGRQIAAMWGYLGDLKRQPLPDKIEQARGEDFELKPTDRPILLRTFMRDAGPHAIAVGFPQGVHFAWDAERLRLANAWTGRFLDAQGTWFIRSAPPADPLGERLIQIDTADAWLLGNDSATELRFGGYQLDRHGVPTFGYEIGPWRIEDRIEPIGAGEGGGAGVVDAGLRRRLSARSTRSILSVDNAADEGDVETERKRLRLVVLRGERLENVVADSDASTGESTGEVSMRNEAGLVVTLSRELARRTRVEPLDGGSAWVVSLVDDAAPQEVVYRWGRE
ncbi:MAG: hypothetical protein EA381_07325 [Planctomycetaceae bacterium]|nr:MAG: hypothetical protein EA381_07325 [Planctomycetaceae bacterium]